ncbi:MAG TPA: DinB family protein [Terriglobia bacterium]|nr:DinB family protein [Terriglobia bacterium]
MRTSTDPSNTDFIRSVLKSQYHAALAMLRQALERCPRELWYSKDQVNAFWQTAYHTLYFTHLYLQTDELAFKPWTHHQSAVQYEDCVAGPPDPNSNLPLLPEPYTQEQVLEYWAFCDAMVDSAVDALDPFSPESGFHWYKVNKLEHQIINIRHIQIGAAQLAARLRAQLNIGLEWVGTGTKARLMARS